MRFHWKRGSTGERYGPHWDDWKCGRLEKKKDRKASTEFFCTVHFRFSRNNRRFNFVGEKKGKYIHFYLRRQCTYFCVLPLFIYMSLQSKCLILWEMCQTVPPLSHASELLVLLTVAFNSKAKDAP